MESNVSAPLRHPVWRSYPTLRAPDAVPTDAEFLGLLNAYRVHGGLSRIREYRLGPGADDLSVPEGAFGFDWGDDHWLPRFQWSAGSRRVVPACAAVYAELGDVFSGLELARWYLTSNAFLDGASPIEVLHAEPGRALHAARLDRFVAVG